MRKNFGSVKKRHRGKICDALTVYVLFLNVDVSDGLGVPLAALVEVVGDDRAGDPGDEKGDIQRVGMTVGPFGRAQEIGHKVGDGDAEQNGGDEGDPHGSGGVARAAHDAGKGLRDAHGDVTHGENPHHANAKGHDLGGGGEAHH